jgi:hypothetical protein
MCVHFIKGSQNMPDPFCPGSDGHFSHYSAAIPSKDDRIGVIIVVII